jgi:hypothetical protein
MISFCTRKLINEQAVRMFSEILVLKQNRPKYKASIILYLFINFVFKSKLNYTKFLL